MKESKSIAIRSISIQCRTTARFDSTLKCGGRLEQPLDWLIRFITRKYREYSSALQVALSVKRIVHTHTCHVFSKFSTRVWYLFIFLFSPYYYALALPFRLVFICIVLIDRVAMNFSLYSSSVSSAKLVVSYSFDGLQLIIINNNWRPGSCTNLSANFFASENPGDFHVKQIYNNKKKTMNSNQQIN